jgi:hypothetical protein
MHPARMNGIRRPVAVPRCRSSGVQFIAIRSRLPGALPKVHPSTHTAALTGTPPLHTERTDAMTTFAPRSAATRASAILFSFAITVAILGATVLGMQPADETGVVQLAVQAITARTTGTN